MVITLRRHITDDHRQGKSGGWVWVEITFDLFGWCRDVCQSPPWAGDGSDVSAAMGPSDGGPAFPTF